MSFRRFSISLAFLALTVLPSAAFAQDQVKELTFEDDNVEGELLAPNESNFSGDLMEDTTSLIKVREDFVPEMIKSAEGL
jgi:hypothetical protein